MDTVRLRHEMHCPDHDVGQCIRGFKLFANIAWDRVDELVIPVNINEKFHWLLVVFRIKHRCLHVYDSMSERSVHNKKVEEVVDKHAIMIPLFLASTEFMTKYLICMRTIFLNINTSLNPNLLKSSM